MAYQNMEEHRRLRKPQTCWVRWAGHLALLRAQSENRSLVRRTKQASSLVAECADAVSVSWTNLKIPRGTLPHRPEEFTTAQTKTLKKGPTRKVSADVAQRTLCETVGTSTEGRTALRNAARLVAGNRPEIPPRPVPAIAAAQAMFSAILYGVPRGVARSC